MSRAWRIEFDGAVYHVLARGNAQEGKNYREITSWKKCWTE